MIALLVVRQSTYQLGRCIITFSSSYKQSNNAVTLNVELFVGIYIQDIYIQPKIVQHLLKKVEPLLQIKRLNT